MVQHKDKAKQTWYTTKVKQNKHGTPQR